MTRLYSTGFETGDKSDVYLEDLPANVMVIKTTGSFAPRTGDYMLRCFDACYAQIGPSLSTTELFGHVAFMHDNAVSVDEVMEVTDNAAVELVQLRVSAAGNLQAYRGDGVLLLQTSTGTISNDIWYHLEFRFYINDTSGSFYMKVDGQEWLNFVGDTKPGTPNTISTFRLRGGNAAQNAYCYFDDLVLNDSAGTGTSAVRNLPGQIRLFPIFPNGAGDVTQLNVSGSATNWGAVDEVPPSSSDYVWSATSGTYDLYAMQDVSIPTGTTLQGIIAIANSAYDSGAGAVANVIKSGGIEVFGVPNTLSSTYRPYQTAIEKDPNGNALWTETSINNLQVGEKAT